MDFKVLDILSAHEVLPWGTKVAIMRATHVSEKVYVPFVVLSRPVTWEVCGGGIGDGFCADPYHLEA